ncbi:MAG: CPBP family intramembrane metalloprotease, partial [Nitrospira sp.]|nr:CPBP family intramembrane metalloprotease [Nitrospira sp.]
MVCLASSDAGLLQRLLDPVSAEFTTGEGVVATVVGLAVCGLLLLAILKILRSFGPRGGELDRDSLILGLPLAFGVFALPVLIQVILRGQDAQAHRLERGVLLVAVTVASIWVLRKSPLRTTQANLPEWTSLHPSAVPKVLGVWLLSFPLMAAAGAVGVGVSTLLGIDIDPQPAISDLKAAREPLEIAGWYLLVTAGAPMSEEFVFRLILYGALAGPLAGLAAASRSQWVRDNAGQLAALVISLSLFVLVHDVLTIGQQHLIVPLAALSLVLTGLYAYSRSIWPPVILHALHNATVV